MDDVLNESVTLDFKAFLKRVTGNPFTTVEEMGSELDNMVERTHVQREHNRFINCVPCL